MLKATIFAFLLALTANTELVETCKSFDKRKLQVVSHISQTFRRPAHEVSEIYDSVISASSKYGLSASTILAVIAVESSFDPNAKSSSGAKGLMQIMPTSGCYVTEHVAKNLDCATGLLANYIGRYGQAGYQIYNTGPRNYFDKGVRAYGYVAKLEVQTKLFNKLLYT